MKPGDLVRVNDLWHRQCLGPGMDSWVEAGSTGVIVERCYQGNLDWGWWVLIGSRRALLNDCYINDCYIRVIDDAAR